MNAPPSFSQRSSVDAHSLRDHISLQRKVIFKPKKLPADVHRVFEDLREKHKKEFELEHDNNQDYDELTPEEKAVETALQSVFIMRTAIELHRSWHMTLPTMSILQQIKDKFELKMTWEIGAEQLKFCFDDGEHDLIRNVKNDYDSEYQDIYMRIAMALISGHINVHEALVFQDDTKKGIYTGKSSKFLRDFPGRLILYPWKASMYALVFFGGNWRDAGIAAICGCFGGLTEWTLKELDLSIVKDLTVGMITGVIGGLFYEYQSEETCLRAIFMATLHWYFFGTAFVVGLLEILVGQLETGVTRFVGVTVKTFVLSLGACLGLMITSSTAASDAWLESSKNHCDALNFREQWYRIPLYLLCCISVLGKHKVPLSQYLRALIVQFVAYEAQFEARHYYEGRHDNDNLDVSLSNIVGAAAGVITACLVSAIVNRMRTIHHRSLLLSEVDANCGTLVNGTRYCYAKISTLLGIGIDTDVKRLQFEKRLQKEISEVKNPDHSRQDITLSDKDGRLFMETFVTNQDLNVWAMLTPSLYQLVPGSLIARLWFDTIFPPRTCDGENDHLCEAENEDVFSALINISVSLSLGLIIGFVFVEIFIYLSWNVACSDRSVDERAFIIKKVKGMYSIPKSNEDDPESEEVDDPESEEVDDSCRPSKQFPVKLNSSNIDSTSCIDVELMAQDPLTSPIDDSNATFFDTSMYHNEEYELVTQK